jgi:prepilin-type N-terminal cleavage/methylation domain-containing protein
VRDSHTKIKSRRRRNPESGFSMIELVMVAVLICIVSAIALIQLQPGLQNARYDAAMRQVLDQLRQAREFSIAHRRFIQISFSVASPYTVTMTQMNTLTPNAGAANPVLSVVPIQSPAQFAVIAGMPDLPVPENYGKGSAIFFNGVPNGPPGGMLFQSDGELVDAATRLPINGTVFIGFPGNKVSARAVSVLGTTGRVRGWRSTGSSWIQF